MTLSRFGKNCFGLILGLGLAGSVYAANLDQLVTDNLNKVARDMHYSSRAVGNEGQTSDVAMGALAKESAAVDSLRRVLSTVETEKEIQTAANQLKAFGYRVSTSAEKRAFREGYSILEKRVKFLAQMENPNLLSSLNYLSSINSEVENGFAKLDTDISSRVQLLASRRSSGTRTNTGMLGANVKNGKTYFSVYSWAATDVKVVIFKNASDKKGTAYPMKKDSNGIWKCALEGELYGTYYGYVADGPNTDGHLFDKTRLLSDPYAFANVDHNGKSIVVNKNFKWTDANFKRPKAKDAIIYEMHIKDFTAHKSSGVTGEKKGKYLGLLEGKGSDKVLGHLKDLGVNAVELLPVHEFDNNFAGVVNHWGYMTSHYFAPECSYATDKSGAAVVEFKKLVNGLHNNGIAVVMDVVYNHTAEGDHRGTPLNLKGLDNPGYYRLMNDKKYYWNGTGCGNEVNSDSPMTRKLIVDSLKYWHEEYHIDGFRFDLGTILDKETFNQILSELPEDVMIFAEPWAADWQRNKWGKSDFRNTRLAKWNDDFREKVRGFVSGNANRNDFMTVMAGTCFWWAAKPQESLNYIAAHDGYTIGDLFHGDKKKSRLAAVALLTSQGIPMIHEGQEFNRSKKGNHNSYDQDNATNWINWEEKRQNIDIFNFYKGLINIRLKYENFRHPVALNSQKLDWISQPNQKAVGMHLKGKTEFLVLLNGDPSNWASFKFPGGGKWTVVCDGERVDDNGLYTAENDYGVPPTTGVILKR